MKKKKKKFDFSRCGRRRTSCSDHDTGSKELGDEKKLIKEFTLLQFTTFA